MFLVLRLIVFVNYVFENVTLTPISSSSLYNSEQIKWKPASHGAEYPKLCFSGVMKSRRV